MKNLNRILRRDNGFDDFTPVGGWILICLGVGVIVALLIKLSISSAALPQTSYTRICGDEKTYTRISVDRCYDSKVDAEWLYVENGDRLPKMGGDTSNTSTRTHGRATIRTAER